MSLTCKIFGHKTVVEVATGNTYQYTDRLTGQTCIGNYLQITRRKHCIRCGEVVHKDMTENSEVI